MNLFPSDNEECEGGVGAGVNVTILSETLHITLVGLTEAVAGQKLLFIMKR